MPVSQIMARKITRHGVHTEYITFSFYVQSICTHACRKGELFLFLLFLHPSFAPRGKQSESILQPPFAGASHVPIDNGPPLVGVHFMSI